EITGSQAYLARHPDVVKRLVGGLHMDMVGGLLATTKGTFHVSRTAESLPHVLNTIARVWFDQLVSASARYAERARAAAGAAGGPPRPRGAPALGRGAVRRRGSDRALEGCLRRRRRPCSPGSPRQRDRGAPLGRAALARGGAARLRGRDAPAPGGIRAPAARR